MYKEIYKTKYKYNIILQEYLFISRSGNIYDFIANSTGALASILIITYLIKTNIIKFNKE